MGITKFWDRLRLFSKIVWRENQADYRTGVRLSWEIACIVHPDCDYRRTAK